MITGLQLRDAFVSASNNISNYRNAVDALNIFPVPDGDTGTNMSMTISAAAKEVASLADDTPACVTAKVFSSALLRSARGNSGVILSLIFRGFSEALTGCTTVNGANIATALELGQKYAYESVSAPVEGTILTVARCAAESARAKVGIDVPALDVFEAACAGADSALKKTPELLHILKKAKVVDAGGQGLVHILNGMLSVFMHGKLIRAHGKSSAENSGQETQQDAQQDARQAAVTAGIFAAAETADIRFAYCTEFIINKTGDKPGDVLILRSYLNSAGDCAVAVEDGNIIKVHVHSNTPGEILTKALEYGELTNIKIENMRQQHRAASWGVGSADAAQDTQRPATDTPQTETGSFRPAETSVPVEAYEYGTTDTRAEPEKPLGIVAVAAGEGLEALFYELGADRVVSGGQTMNPSTQDILNAVNSSPSESVIILPNNKNIILASRQTVFLTDKKVTVIPTNSVPEGIAAMLSFDGELSAEINAQSMAAAAEGVQTSLVTFAARDSVVNSQNVRKGQILGLENGKITTVTDDVNTAAFRVARHIIKRSTSVMTIYYGEGVTQKCAESLCAMLEKKYGDEVEFSVINGGQPVYYYIISAE